MNTPNNSNSPIDEEQPTQPKSLIEVIFGSKVADSNISEGTIEKALDFRVEQEKTKQQYYRLENINKSIELFKLARDLGVPATDISRLFNAESVAPPGGRANVANGRSGSAGSGSELLSRQPLSYRFPPAGSNLLPKPVALNNGSRDLSSRRTNSPARIGASAVAALNENVVIKEEETNSTGSPFSRKSGSHSRNYSLPITKLNGATIPSGMTSILSFNKEQRGNETSTSQPLAFSNSNVSTATSIDSNTDNNPKAPSVRKSSMVTKKHRRTRSASSFGVIDLNVINDANQQDALKSKDNDSKSNFERRHDCDEKTCSESSSRNESPVRAISGDSKSRTSNPVAKILNST